MARAFIIIGAACVFTAISLGCMWMIKYHDALVGPAMTIMFLSGCVFENKIYKMIWDKKLD